LNQIAVNDDLTARRREAARKAVATRRSRLANGISSPIAAAFAISPSPREMALLAFEQAARAADSGAMPDWHGAALVLKAALTGGSEWQESKTRVLRQARPTALPAPAWHDYPVNGANPFHLCNPTVVVTFADGEVVRAPAVSRRGKPVNIGRGLRIAIAFYQARIAWRSGLKNEAGYWTAVPPITSCYCEDTGETFDAQLCTIKTTETRKPHEWRIHERRRLEASPQDTR